MIKEEKIPSPTELKNTPIQFTNEEITQLRNLQDKFNQTTVQFGQLGINKLKLEEAEVTLKNRLFELEKEEIDLAKGLSDKYGKGSLDIETGTFTPAE
jgi:hypothetical protein|tara:strand:- start:70 stop:363 length:294 start_codon:yes stop_codon:yes gene_type:complete